MLEVMKCMENPEIYSDKGTLLNLLDDRRFFCFISYFLLPHTIFVFTVYSKDLVLFVAIKVSGLGTRENSWGAESKDVSTCH